MYYLVVHVIVEIAHVIFQTTVKFQLIVDCSATYFIFMNSLFQGIVSTGGPQLVRFQLVRSPV
mgnify:CR=1 FL=1